MKRFVLCLSIVLLCIAPAHSSERTGRVVSVAGKVLLRNTLQPSLGVKIAAAGDNLIAGSAINTSSDSSVRILLDDKTVLDVGASTLFKIDDYKPGATPSERQVGMSMDYGKVRASVNAPVGPQGRFNIKTKTATMGVRGTEFVIAAGLPIGPRPTRGSSRALASEIAASATQVTVMHGKVEVQNSNAPASAPPVAVTAGQQLSTGNIAEVKSLSVTEVKAVRESSVVRDNTFAAAVTVESKGSSNSKGGGPASGLETLAALAESVTAAAGDLKADAVPVGIPGLFNTPNQNQGNPNGVQVGQPVRLNVSFTR